MPMTMRFGMRPVSEAMAAICSSIWSTGSVLEEPDQEPLPSAAVTFALMRSNTRFSRAREALITRVRARLSSSAWSAPPAFSRSWSSIGTSRAFASQLYVPSVASNSMRVAGPPTARLVS